MTIILCDVDGVVADMIPAWLRKYNVDYHDMLTVEHITQWHLHELVKPECGGKIYDYLDDEHLYDDVKPVDGSTEALWYLQRKGYRIVYLTAGIHSSKVKWLNRWGLLDMSKVDYGGYLYHPDVVVCKDKSIIRGDYLVDDGVHNMRDDIHSILFDQPWNRDCLNYPRAMDWFEVIGMITK